MVIRPRLELFASNNAIPLSALNGRLFLRDSATNVIKVVGAAIAPDGNYVAALTLDKEVIVLDISKGHATAQETGRHVLPKRPTAISFVPSGDAVLVADAFGDVYHLPLTGALQLRDEAVGEQACVLGHFSTVTDVCVGRHHLATCDRDGRVRVSRWPDCFVITAFCLGHTDVVTAVSMARDYVVSGGADGTLRVWTLDGACVSCIGLKGTVVEEHLVSARGDDDGDDSKNVTVELFVTCVLLPLWKDDCALFIVHGCRAVFEVCALSDGAMGEVRLVRTTDGVVNGIAADDTGLWVSVDGSQKLRRWDLRADNPTDCSDEVDVYEEGKSADVDGCDGGRFDWLFRQRKKEMVEDWKGKKRRHVEI